MKVKTLIYSAACIALATVTSMLKLYSFPFGGSVTLFSMLFMAMAGYMFGPVVGISASVAYGLLQFFLEPYFYTPLQFVTDYLLAFGALGLSGFFASSKKGLIKGYIVAVIGRYIFAVISGWIFFGEYAWEGWGALPYSLAYNGCYIFTEAAVTVAILCVPSVYKAIEKIKTSAK